MKQFDREQFVRDVRGWVALNVPFRHQGRSLETGIDCVNLPRMGCEAQGVILPHELTNAMEVYSEQPDGRQMIALLDKWFTKIDVVNNTMPDAQPGDLIVFYVFRNPKHMAILSSLEPLRIIEAWRSPDKRTGKLHETPLDFRRRIARCYRIPDAA